MKTSSSTKLNLATLGNLASDADRMLSRICENIADPETNPDEIRKLTITIAVTPLKKRQGALVQYTVKCALGHPVPGTVLVQLAMDEHQQLSLFSVPPQDESPIRHDCTMNGPN